MDERWLDRFALLKAFGWFMLAGLVLLLLAVCSAGNIQKITAVLGALLCIPAFCYGYVLVIWHWKDRYRGNHSDLWGAIILIETSGWMKIVYFFRHMLPDMCHSGRYRTEPSITTFT